MRNLVWNADTQKYECSECRWKQALCVDCSDPAERLELQFDAHCCEEHQQRKAA